jgi:uncharacterized membrane protein YcaP (DUF421 family)
VVCDGSWLVGRADTKEKPSYRGFLESATRWHESAALSATRLILRDMTDMATPVLQIVARSLLVYVGVLVGLVVILLIANAVQNAMVGSDVSIQGGLLAAGVLLVTNRVVAGLRIHSGIWGRLIEGTPTVLVQDGQFLEAALRKEGLERRQVQMAMREHGVDSIEQIKLAVLETDGSISIVPEDARMIRTRKHVRQIRH